MMNIEKASDKDYDALVNVWESAVRATHHFLSEEDINALKSQLKANYFPQVTLYLVRNSAQQIQGFLGIADNRIEMLFIDALSRGQGIGKALITYAITTLSCDEVDVNEQNPQAVGFYLHQGFEQVGRSPLDGQGRPFPLLHLKLRR